jgi:hypothetical protein
MPFDPDSPFGPADPSQWWQSGVLPRVIVHPKPPPNAPAFDNGIDDWFVPAQAQKCTDLPPWSPETDASYPDDWIYPDDRNAPTPARPATAGAKAAAQRAQSPHIQSASGGAGSLCSVLVAHPGKSHRLTGLGPTGLSVLQTILFPTHPGNALANAASGLPQLIRAIAVDGKCAARLAA